MQIFKNTNFNFMRYKYLAYVLSGLVIIAGIINITKGKGLKFGIDFSGGTLVRIMFKQPVSVAEVRAALANIGLGSSKIQELEKSKREYLVRTVQASEEELQEDIEAEEIIANKVIDALRGEEEKKDIEKGLKDLNQLDIRELTALLQGPFPDTASELASGIVSFRIEEGILRDYSQLNEICSQEVIEELKKKTFLGNLVVLSKETVGPQVGHDLRVRAIQATVWALIGMLIYIAFRFKFAFGVSAVITLGHDVLVTMSIYSFTNREINLPVVAAVMTLVGYSLNDTIVIFDRIRDNLKSLRKLSFEGLLNASINQTLSRTIITSGTTFLTLFALFLFGGEVINDFCFAMIIGIIAGSYSTIYQSCSLLYLWQKLFKPKKGMGRK